MKYEKGKEYIWGNAMGYAMSLTPQLKSKIIGGYYMSSIMSCQSIPPEDALWRNSAKCGIRNHISGQQGMKRWNAQSVNRRKCQASWYR